MDGRRRTSLGGGAGLAIHRRRQPWTQLSPALRERICASASTLFDVELGTYERSMPDDQALAAIAVPVLLVVSADSHDFFAEVAGRLRSDSAQM